MLVAGFFNDHAVLFALVCAGVAWQVLANAERALAIELLAGAQAVEFLAPLEPGAGVRAARAHVRELSARLHDDRPLAGDIEAVATSIRDGSLLAAVEAEVGGLA